MVTLDRTRDPCTLRGNLDFAKTGSQQGFPSMLIGNIREAQSITNEVSKLRRIENSLSETDSTNLLTVLAAWYSATCVCSTSPSPSSSSSYSASGLSSTQTKT